MKFRLKRYAKFRLRFVFIASAAAYVLWVPGARSAAYVCVDDRVVVVSSGEVDTRNICGGAKDAISFLKRNGLVLKSDIEINIVRKFPSHVKIDVFGCYDQRQEKIYILEFELCGTKFKSSVVYGTGSTKESYRGLIAHEVAHSIVLQNFPKKFASWVVQEYIAYVTQLATLPPRHRERILERVGGRGFEKDSQINATVLMASPDFFAVNAYRHFIKPENGKGFLRRLLAGSIRLDDSLFQPKAR